MLEKTYMLLGAYSTLRLSKDGQLSYMLDGKYLWESTGPFCILHYYDQQQQKVRTLRIPSPDVRVADASDNSAPMVTSEMCVELFGEHEWLVMVRCPALGLRFALRVYFPLVGTNFSIILEGKDLQEEFPDCYKILGLEILPGFGMARNGEAGYLLTPNWCGCQTFFNKTTPHEIWQSIYNRADEENQECTMPVFGITRAQGTLCGLVIEGELYARLISRVCWGEGQNNSIHPYLVYRWNPENARLPGPHAVRYAFAPPNYEYGEGYAFCAQKYREWLHRERGLLTRDEKVDLHPEVADYPDRFCIQIQLGWQKPQPDGSKRYQITTSFEEARLLLEECQARGMHKLMVLLLGWEQEGYNTSSSVKYPVDARLGGEKAMLQFLDWCREHDIRTGRLGVDDEAFSAKDVASVINARDQYREMLTTMRIRWGGVFIRRPFGVYVAAIDGILQVNMQVSPAQLASPFGKYFYDRSVPLLPMALHGCVMCCQEMQAGGRYLLEMLDYGLSPQYTVSMHACPSRGIPAFVSEAQRLADTYQFFYGATGAVNRLSHLTAAGRWELAEGVSETLYSDSTLVRLNRTDEDFNEIPAMCYAIVRDEEEMKSEE